MPSATDWRDDYDPKKLLANIHEPVLILQGERDIQVSEIDAHQLKQANPAATLELLLNTNHVLKSVATTLTGHFTTTGRSRWA